MSLSTNLQTAKSKQLLATKSTLGEACCRLDFISVHETLEKAGYKDDEGIAKELSFEEWKSGMQEALNSKKQGDAAFRTRDFAAAIVFYTEFIEGGTMASPTALARRCLSYLMRGMHQEALGDALRAQVMSPEWPTAYYLQVAALLSLKMDNEAQDSLLEAISLEVISTRNIPR